MAKHQYDFNKLKEKINFAFGEKDAPPDEAIKGLESVENCIKKGDFIGVRDAGEKVLQSLSKYNDIVCVPAETYKEISLICWGVPLPKQEAARKDKTPPAEPQKKDEMPIGKTKRVLNIPVETKTAADNKPVKDEKDTKRMAATFHGTGQVHPSTLISDDPEDVAGYKKIKESDEQIKKRLLDDVEKMKKTLADRAKELDEKDQRIKQLEIEVKRQITVNHEKQETINAVEKNLNDLYSENQEKQQNIDKLEEHKKEQEKLVSDLWGEISSLKHAIEITTREQKEAEYRHESKVRKLKEDISSLTAQRDDLRDRFSKVAGAKLSDNNAAIADLSDPNRAMKLAERFAAIYDDEWTDAFQEQKEKIKKKSDKNVVQHLLKVLVDCYQFCQKIADQQMDVLNNVLLHPCQDASLDRNISGVSKGPNQPRVHSKDVKIMKEARRKIATEAIAEVKEQFITKMRQDPNTDKKAMECSLSYYEKCAEICWHMVLHDPVLQLKLDVKEGDKMDLNLFTIYQSSGSVIEYLVWPPLFNGKDGGLLNKGVAQPTKDSGKASKK